MRSSVATILFVMVIVLAATATANDESTGEQPAFSGSWILNAEESDDPAATARGAKGTRSGGNRVGRGRRGGGGHGGGMGRSGGDASGPGADLDRGGPPPNRDNRAAIGSLEIFSADTEFNLTDGMGISRVLEIGGEPATVFTPQGEAQATAAWDGDVLVLNESAASGVTRRTLRFIMLPATDQLVVTETRRLPGGGDDGVFRLVYDRRGTVRKP